MNIIKTSILLATMTALFGMIGWLISGTTGMIIAFCIGLAMNFYSYWNSDKALLKMHNAVRMDHTNAPELYNMTEKLAQSADLPMPALYMLESDQPNAFATGRSPDHAAVAVSRGLLDLLSKEEVAGVVAHELSHIQNRDTLTMTITATFAGAISMLVNFMMFFGGNRKRGLGIIGTLLVILVAPVTATLIQMAVSRTREYSADQRGAEICGNPIWLANALQKMADYAKRIPNHAAERNPATAHLFIINPLGKHKHDNLFSTHPNVQNRITALHKLADEWAIKSI